MLQSCTAVLHGHRVSYLRAGEGSAVVLLHGIGSNSMTWEPVASALAEAHDVIGAGPARPRRLRQAPRRLLGGRPSPTAMRDL